MEAKKLTQSKNKTKHTQPHAHGLLRFLHTITGNTNRNANPEKKKKTNKYKHDAQKKSISVKNVSQPEKNNMIKGTRKNCDFYFAKGDPLPLPTVK